MSESLEGRRLFSTVYYVSPAGDDLNPGTSIDAPWASVDKVNATTFAPGDSILFEGGATFDGGVSFGPDDAAIATAAAAMTTTVGSYGGGRATLRSGDGPGVRVHNAAGFTVRDLVLVGSGNDAGNDAGVATNSAHGLEFFNDLPADVKLEHAHVDNVDVSGYGGWGVAIGGWNAGAGWRDVRVTRSDFHHNGQGGLTTYAQSGKANENVYVGHVRAFDNLGTSTTAHHSGNGITLGNVNGAVVEHSVAYGNGSLNLHKGGGPVGIWAYEANDVLIQFNESYDNRTGSDADGGGFDFDGGVTNSVMQYNYSHGNDGAGYGLFEYPGASAWSGNTVRYNVSENDGRKNGYAGIHLWDGGSGLRGAEIYNNTVYVAPAAYGRPAGIFVHSPTTDVHFRNNVIYVVGGVPAVDVAGGQLGMRFEGNLYWSQDAPLQILWAGSAYDTLEAWRAASGQERVGVMDTGMLADPMFASSSGARSVSDTDPRGSLAAFAPRPGSPLVDRGVDMTGFGIDPGRHDLVGTALVQAGGYDVGAVEKPILPGDANRDDVVNFADLLALAKNYNLAGGAAWEHGDFNRDGAVNFSDLLMLAKNYNKALPAQPGVTAGAALVAVGSGAVPPLSEVLALASQTAASTATSPAVEANDAKRVPPKPATRADVKPVVAATPPVFSAKKLTSGKRLAAWLA